MIEQVIRLTVRCTVTEQQAEAFKAVAAQMTEGSKAEPGTLGYEWFASADGKTFHLLETYTNASAMEAHFMGPVVQQLVPKLVTVSTVEGLTIYGEPSAKVAEMAAGWGAETYSYWNGIAR
jgi:quinol monooxygenase YgiN